ncbi:hypothetical protein [Treponema sp.]|uniref:hypothetical protein n=1 Tax=Treponema sp. TaxID=166 RepID=UPI00298DD241|nr:hypothetical protein [Treponema sp.]
MRKINLVTIIFIILSIVSCAKKDEKTNISEETEEIIITSDILDTENIGEENSNIENKKEFPPAIEGKSDVYFDGSMYFWDLNVNDAPEKIKEKLIANNCDFEDGTDYADVYKIWNKGIMMEEWLNLNFMLSCYKGKLFNFTKWNISLQELQDICNFYGQDFDVLTLQNPQYYIFKKDLL